MSKNGSITSFFKPAVKSSRSPQHNAAAAAAAPNPNESTPPPPSPSPLPGFFSSSPPAAPTSAVRDRNAVIRGSDDEDSNDFDSDDDFPSLFPSTKPPTITTTTTHQPPHHHHHHDTHATKTTDTTRTPTAKRRALTDDFLSSPLTINTRRQQQQQQQQQQHKFDMQAFLKHAEADLALEESELRTAALLAQVSPTGRHGHRHVGSSGGGGRRRVGTAEEEGSGGSGGGGGGGGLYDAMLDVLSDADDSQGEGHKGRLLRAVKRTEAAVQRREWFFFDRMGNEGREIKARPAFPKAKATGVWALLAAPEKQRVEVFEDGLPYHVQCKMHNLPDEIFLWVLGEACHERSARLRDEYLRLLGACSDQVARLVDEDVIVTLFRDLGASDRALAEGTSQPADACEKGAPYPEQNRGRLRATLRGLAEMAHAMRLPALTRAMSILLRLGIDNMMREDYVVAADYQDALYHIVAAVPWRSWDNFCGNTSRSLYSHTQETTLRWNAVSSIPLLHAKLIELRRRLALVFIFDDPQRAFSRPEGTFSVRSVIDRLDQADEFVVDRNNTDYFELLALSEMLSVAVGDGSPPAGDEASPETVKQYNADVDELAQRVKFMWSNIHEQGAAYMSRLEARVQLKDFERKLQHVVRTRPPPKDNIFGIDARDDDEVERPKQQQFMKRFLSKNQPPPKKP